MLGVVALFAVPAPAVLAAAAVSERRRDGFLVRGSLASACVAFAAALSGTALSAQAGWVPDGAVLAPALAAAPWVAGEILSGPSAFRVEALLGAIAAAQALSALSPVAAALAAAGMYLAARGPCHFDSTNLRNVDVLPEKA